jgi:hypothetical protein
LIDPSAPSSSLLSHCTRLETEISWNQAGPKGDPGAPGLPGKSPTVTPLSAGDPNCPAGGAAITDAAGSIAYVCSGPSFGGTFTSPDGKFSLSVTDNGVEISGPDAKVSLPSGGGVTVTSDGSVSVKGDRVETVANNETITVGGNRTETVGNDESITVGGNRTETVDKNENVTVSGNRTQTVDHDENVTVGGNRTETVGSDENVTVEGNRTETAGTLGLRATGALDFVGSLVGINSGSGSVCRGAARIADTVDSIAILTGSSTVCIGG